MATEYPFTLALKTAPTVEPVTTAEAKTHMRVETDADDTYIGTLISAARRYAETFTGRQLISATWYLYLREFPDVIHVPKPPLASVTSIKYYDADGAQQTLAAAAYAVDISAEPGTIEEAYGYSWPSIRSIPKTITIEYICGYGASGSYVPEPIRQAILLMAAHWYSFREPVVAGTNVTPVPMAADALLNQYRHGYLF